MQPHLTFNVIPKLPTNLEPLREIAYNLWWTWETKARRLFYLIDKELWHQTNHNPLRMLQLAKQQRFEELAQDDSYLKELKEVHRRFKNYLKRKDTYGKGRQDGCTIAYFSAEFGFHESFPNYSGGLGILSGDHCKSASDLGLDFIAVSLLYRHGYFKQQINKDGQQEAIELNQNFRHLPVVEVAPDGEPLKIGVEIQDRTVYVKIWEMSVGRIKLYLLDTDIKENSPHDRLITAQLYGGDIEMRIEQEIVLGIGGVRALHALNIHPQVYHMNEGHSAFLSLERIQRYMERDQLDFRSALQVVASSNVFTTHTPVPAGNDAFSSELMHKYFESYIKRVGIGFDEFYSFGQARTNPEPTFSMTILALRTSRHSNGVSELHGHVSQQMWKDVWTHVPVDEVPITSITNGIHTKTWLAPEFDDIFLEYLGEDWEDHLTDSEFWRRVIDIPDKVLWGTHIELKRRLIEFVRQRLRIQRERNGASPDKLRSVNTVFDPDILTIGFARRFATYKRATMLFSDPDRLHHLLNHPEHPVQFLFAGKAHPKDKGGQELIRTVYEYSQKEGFGHRIAFIEDYDAYVGRRLYQGVDLWLNNPLRPLEASGTSGMKLPPNGGLNLSVLDGWWCEAWNGNNGWAIAPEIEEGSPEFQTEVDSLSLYQLLENQIAPLYYAKPDGKRPIAWIRLMRESMRSVTPAFNTHRMVMEYNERLYEGAAKAYKTLSANGCEEAKKLSTWKTQMRHDWSEVRIEHVELQEVDPLNVPVGDNLKVQARVHLGKVQPEHIEVQAYFGESDDGEISEPAIVSLKQDGEENGVYLYEGKIAASDSGSYGLTVRVLPTHPHLVQPHELRLITWSE